MKIAIIPARSGSKRIKNKNIKLFNGLPMMAWALNEITKKNFFDKVYCDTDSIAISKIANKYGALTPFLRPKYLARDSSSIRDALSFFLKKLIKYNHIEENCDICIIYATAFTLRIDDLKKSYKYFVKANPEYLVSATNFRYPVKRSFEIDKNHKIKMLFPKMYFKRSQDLKETYHDASQFLWTKKDSIINKKPVFTKKSLIYKVPINRVIDIDTPEDWEFAEFMNQFMINK